MSEARKYLEVVERLREIGLLGDHALLAETTQLFRKDAADMLVVMKEGFAKGDAAALHRASHRLKGAALNLGATGIAVNARTIEEGARRGELIDVAASIKAIESELQCVGDFLTGLAKDGAPL